MKFCVSFYIFLFLILSGCGGSSSERAGFIDIPDLSVTNIAVDGGVLLLNGVVVEEGSFNPDATGPYSVDIDEGEESITIIPTFTESEGVIGQIVRFFPDEDNRVDAEVTEINSGDSFQWDLSEGDNIIEVRLQQTETNATVTYIIEATRVSSEAEVESFQAFLSNRLAIDSYATVDEFIESEELLGFVTEMGAFPEEFIADDDLEEGQSPIREYNLVADYDLCQISLRFGIAGKLATATLNGESYDSFSTPSFPLEIGENNFEVVVNSEQTDPETEESVNTATYTFNITREEGTLEERLADSRFLTLDFNSSDSVDESGLNDSGGVLSPEFRCNTSSYNYVIPFNFTNLTLAATTSPDFALFLSRVALNEDGAEVIVSDSLYVNGQRRTIVDGVGELITSSPFDGFTFDDPENIFNLEIGSNLFVIDALPREGVSGLRRQTLFNIVRSESNRIRVSSVEGLVEALELAEPRDEIVLSEGVYSLSEMDESALSPPYFLANQSGTVDEPIILRAELGEEVVLEGFGIDDENSVFRLETDYWEVEGIDFRNAANGLVINNGNNNTLRAIDISDVGQEGLVIQNGSSNNKVISAQVFSTGQKNPEDETIAREAIRIGGTGEPSENNFIWNSSFIDIPAQQIVVEDDAVSSSIHFNTLVNEKELTPNDTLIQINSDSSVIGFNDIFVTSSESLINQTISVDGVSEAIEVDVFNNQLDTDRDSLALVSVAEGDQAFVSGNQLLGGVLSIGSGIVNSEVDHSIFQIRPLSNPEECISFETVDDLRDIGDEDLEEPSTIDVLTFSPCESIDSQLSKEEILSSQLWRLVRDEDLFLTIEPAINENFRWVPSRDTTLDLSIFVQEKTGDFSDLGFVFRWRIRLVGSTSVLSSASQDFLPVVRIGNRDSLNSSFSLEYSDTFLTDRNILRLSPLIGDDSFNFILVPVN